MNKWINLGVKGGAIWPTEETTVNFGGHELILKPATKETEQSIHILLKGISDLQAMTLANRFLSIISWCDECGMENLYGWSGSPVPVTVPRQSREIGSSIAFLFSRDIEKNPKASLALALFREAKTINSVPYEFLGYFKILNIVWKDKYIDGKNQIVEGIRSKLKNIEYDQVKARISELEGANEDVAKYLYESGRCAVAHANLEPIVDPDEMDDLHRLSSDMPIVKEIAEIVMESDLQIGRNIYG